MEMIGLWENILTGKGYLWIFWGIRKWPMQCATALLVSASTTMLPLLRATIMALQLQTQDREHPVMVQS
jgi:hypothetical protein